MRKQTKSEVRNQKSESRIVEARWTDSGERTKSEARSQKLEGRVGEARRTDSSERTKPEVRDQKSESGKPEGPRVAVYPGSFDPITLGHLDVVKRATHLFDKVVVGVASRQEKHPLFAWKERIQLAKDVTRGMDRVVVQGFDCLLVDFVQQQHAQAIIRGMRAVMDFDYEFQMALTNRKLAPAVETVFFVPSERYFYLSSSLVRELAAKGGELACFVPEQVVRALRRKVGETGSRE